MYVLNLFFVLKKFPAQIISVSWDYWRNFKRPFILKEFNFIFCLRKFYGDFQFFQLRMFNCSSPLKAVADLCSRDKGKSASNTCGYMSNFISHSQFIKFQTLSGIFDFQQGGARSVGTQGRACALHPPLSYGLAFKNYKALL